MYNYPYYNIPPIFTDLPTYKYYLVEKHKTELPERSVLRIY